MAGNLSRSKSRTVATRTPLRALVTTIAIAMTSAATWPGAASAQSANDLFTSENVGRSIGAVAGALVGSQIGGGNGKLAAVAAGTLAGYWAGGKIGRSLEGSGASGVPVTSGQPMPDTTPAWADPQEQSYATPAVYEPALRAPLRELPAVEEIDAPYIAAGNVNVRGGPGTQYMIVDRLRRGDEVFVHGKVADRDWLMVSLDSGDAGFVYRPLLTPAPDDGLLAAAHTRATQLPALPETSRLAIAGLDTGMTVRQASAVVRESFGAEPDYNAATGLMTLGVGGCPPGFSGDVTLISPRPGWKCLRAWFSGEAAPRLERVELVQVTERNTTPDVAGVLEERFGPWNARWETDSPGDGGQVPGDDAMHLAWGDVVAATPVTAGPPRPHYELEALVTETGPWTVTRLTRLADGASMPAGSQGSLQAAAGRTGLTL